MISQFSLLEVRFPWALVLALLCFLYWKHRSISKALTGCMKSLFGYFMVGLASNGFGYSTAALSELLQVGLGIRGGLMNTEAFGATLLMRYGSEGFLVMFCALGINFLLVRWTRWKAVYLTAHHCLYMSLFGVMLMSVGTELKPVTVILLSALLLGIYNWASVGITKRIIGQGSGLQNVGMANSSAGAALIGWFSSCIFGRGKREQSAQPMKTIGSIPIIAGLSLFMAYLLVSLLAGLDVAKATLGSRWLWASCVRSMFFGAQITFLLYGMRMLLLDVTEMVWTAAERMAPEAWKGLDATVIISAAPQAWQVGFICACIGNAVVTALMLAFKAPFVPFISPASMYFSGGVAGVCASFRGGRRSIRFAGVLTGVLGTALIGMIAAALPAEQMTGVVFGETEYGLWGLILQGVCKWMR